VSATPTGVESLELGVVRARPALDRSEWLRLARRARWLSWASLAYMGFEGAVAVVAGILAGSIALTGFGIDSAIEGAASLIVVWRFTGSRLLSERAEGRAQKLVSISFFLLAPYIAVEALRDLIGADHPEASWVGIGLAAASLALMPALGIAKRRIGERIGSPATAGEGAQNLLCAYTSAARDSRKTCAPPSSMTWSSSAGVAASATSSLPSGAPSGGAAILTPAPSGAPCEETTPLMASAGRVSDREPASAPWSVGRWHLGWIARRLGPKNGARWRSTANIP
jgi:hypothetical protein